MYESFRHFERDKQVGTWDVRKRAWLSPAELAGTDLSKRSFHVYISVVYRRQKRDTKRCSFLRCYTCLSKIHRFIVFFYYGQVASVQHVRERCREFRAGSTEVETERRPIVRHLKRVNGKHIEKKPSFKLFPVFVRYF